MSSVTDDDGSDSYATCVSSYDRLRHSISRSAESNEKRIAQIEKSFGTGSQILRAPGRFLVGEGVLTKACRKKLKPRQFFLFNDLLGRNMDISTKYLSIVHFCSLCHSLREHHGGRQEAVQQAEDNSARGGHVELA
jgi:hypothetical protein